MNERTEQATLYQTLVAAGVPTDSHETDLYFLASPHALAILARFPNQQAIAKPFTIELDGKRWVEVPFAYDPGWKRLERVTPQPIRGQA